ncbi:hypothetical protein PVK06_025138 [Gossypium arboreum]|uniref:Uncharacterized protein n=1 Tax=Gossypium arboreum TaxID=29729 RepID=A0ABR0PFV0_GOSAR|nr:hypothetical protein PVK06_025138 [Gossypium arboreum]
MIWINACGNWMRKVVCGNDLESIMHISRDCPALAKLWCHFAPTTKQRLFSDAARVDCLLVNLKRDHVCPLLNLPWNLLFAHVC